MLTVSSSHLTRTGLPRPPTTAAAATWPVEASAQQQPKRIGILLPAAADDAENQARLAAFLQGLAQLGWVVGRNVAIDIRWATTNADDIRRHVTELVGTCAPRRLILRGQRHADFGPLATGDPHGADRVHGRR